MVIWLAPIIVSEGAFQLFDLTSVGAAVFRFPIVEFTRAVPFLTLPLCAAITAPVVWLGVRLLRTRAWAAGAVLLAIYVILFVPLGPTNSVLRGL